MTRTATLWRASGLTLSPQSILAPTACLWLWSLTGGSHPLEQHWEVCRSHGTEQLQYRLPRGAEFHVGAKSCAEEGSHCARAGTNGSRHLIRPSVEPSFLRCESPKPRPLLELSRAPGESLHATAPPSLIIPRPTGRARLSHFFLRRLLEAGFLPEIASYLTTNFAAAVVEH